MNKRSSEDIASSEDSPSENPADIILEGLHDLSMPFEEMATASKKVTSELAAINENLHTLSQKLDYIGGVGERLLEAMSQRSDAERKEMGDLLYILGEIRSRFPEPWVPGGTKIKR
jgi:hypothetical protein